MGELDADRRALPLHEGDQRLETFDLGVVPEAQVVFVDQADLLDRGAFDEHKPEAAERVTPEMHQVKGAAGVAGFAAIVNHRRHDETVLQRYAANRHRLEQFWPHCSLAVGCPLTHAAISSATPPAR